LVYGKGNYKIIQLDLVKNISKCKNGKIDQ
jgi:hypothetical protein